MHASWLSILLACDVLAGSAADSIASCSASCSTEFVDCSNFWIAREFDTETSYERCRNKLDRGEDGGRMTGAGCEVGCTDTAEMAALLGDGGEDEGAPPPSSSAAVVTLEANTRGSPQTLSEVCAEFPERTGCEILLDVPASCAASADPTGACPVIFFLHGATGRSACHPSKATPHSCKAEPPFPHSRLPPALSRRPLYTRLVAEQGASALAMLCLHGSISRSCVPAVPLTQTPSPDGLANWSTSTACVHSSAFTRRARRWTA